MEARYPNTGTRAGKIVQLYDRRSLLDMPTRLPGTTGPVIRVAGAGLVAVSGNVRHARLM